VLELVQFIVVPQPEVLKHANGCCRVLEFRAEQVEERAVGVLLEGAVAHACGEASAQFEVGLGKQLVTQVRELNLPVAVLVDGAFQQFGVLD